MTKIVERYAAARGDDNASRAMNILVRAGAQFVESALVDNPDGPVQAITTLGCTETVYEVVIGDASLGDHGRARTIWHRVVAFGHTDRNVAGGPAFVEAARTQDDVACAALELVHSATTKEEGSLP